MPQAPTQTIGVDVGDTTSRICVLNPAGEVGEFVVILHLKCKIA